MPEIQENLTDIDEKARLESGRVLFAQACDFMLSVVNEKDLPRTEFPEIAFCGRSNVGKSSLVNALTGRKTLARTSNTPGRTQMLNFFNLGQKLIMVDLPGYGYAKVSKKEVKTWTRLIMDYLRGRRELSRAILLIDSRHGLKDTDREVMKTLDDAAVNYQIVMTKTDKIKPKEVEAVTELVRAEAAKHVAAHPEIFVTSSVTGEGIAELRAALADIAYKRR